MTKLQKGSKVRVSGHWPPRELGLVEEVHEDPRLPEPLFTVNMANGTRYVKIERASLREVK